MMMMALQQSLENEDCGRSRLFVENLCETDRFIIESKRLDVQSLIERIITESANSLAIVPVRRSTRRRSKESALPRFQLDWDAHWPSTDHFYQQITSMLGLPVTIQSGSSSKATPASQENMIVSRTDRFDIKSLRTVMEHELQELGLARLHEMECDTCHRFFSAENLYVITLPESQKTGISTVPRCGECWKGKLPSRSIFDILIKGIAEKWAKMVGKRVECLYGDWDERLNPMVKMLKENVLLAEDIARLLRKAVDPHEFKDACEVIILTTIVFYLEYVDFRRSCEALIKMKPTVTHAQLFEIFAIYFPNRAKGIKTGDFL